MAGYIKNKYRIGKLLDREFGKYIGYDKDYLEVTDMILSYLDPKLEKCYTCDRLTSELRDCSKEGCNRRLCCIKKCMGMHCNYEDIIYCEEHRLEYTREFMRDDMGRNRRSLKIFCKLCLCRIEQQTQLNAERRGRGRMMIISEERMNEICRELGIRNLEEIRRRREVEERRREQRREENVRRNAQLDVERRRRAMEWREDNRFVYFCRDCGRIRREINRIDGILRYFCNLECYNNFRGINV